MTDPIKARRDALGHFCFFLHLAILAFIVLGWAIPWRGVLIFYLFFLPGVILHWKLNGNACALNNLESWLRYRRWRAPERNPEEGAWLRTLIGSLTGIVLTRAADGCGYLCRDGAVLGAWHGGTCCNFKGLEAAFFQPI